MKLTKLFTLLIVILSLVGCTSDFEEINTDPNNLDAITPGSVLNPVIYQLAKRNAIQYRSVTAPLMQAFIRADDFIYSPFLYDLDPNIGASTWNDYYRWLNNIQEMEMAADDLQNNNYKAIALTLKAYAFSVLTDAFGDIPMEDALKAESGVWYPEYTEQKDIYPMLIGYLETANNLYDSEENLIYVEDILFQNDLSKWRKFTNSLHLRLLLRASNRSEMDAFNRLSVILNNPETYPIFNSLNEQAVLKISGIPPLMSPWDRPQDFNSFRYVTEFFVDNLKDSDDPRLPHFANTATGQNNENYGYIGMPTDFINTPLPDSIATPSGINRHLAEAPMIIPILSYAEVCFIQAELALKGYLNSSAEEHYNNGVMAAIQMWDLEVSDELLEQPGLKFNNSLEQIMLQKYYALFFTDYQAWFEHRRTGLPELETTSSMLNNGEMPARLYYPIDEVDMNYSNAQDAIDRIGGNEINIKVWWAQ